MSFSIKNCIISYEMYGIFNNKPFIDFHRKGGSYVHKYEEAISFLKSNVFEWKIPQLTLLPDQPKFRFMHTVKILKVEINGITYDTPANLYLYSGAQAVEKINTIINNHVFNYSKNSHETI